MLMRLAEKIGPKNFQMGIYLGLDKDAIKGIRANHKDDVVICAFEILTVWMQKCDRPDSATTFGELCRALTDLERKDLVELVRSGE